MRLLKLILVELGIELAELLSLFLGHAPARIAGV